MSKKFIPVALLSSLALITSAAFAAESAFPTNPERNFFGQEAAPVARTRMEVQTELADFRRSPVSADGWQYVGGEREWAQPQHKFVYAGGAFTHSDECDHSMPPRPTLSMSAEEKTLYRQQYGNSF